MTIAPGVFETPMGDEMPAEIDGVARQDGAVSATASGGPRNSRRSCARSSHNVMLNGEVIRLDGAIRMAPK